MTFRYHDWIEFHARRTPEKTAVVDIASNRRFSYAAFFDRIQALASFLRRDLAVKPGDRVCVLARSCVEVFEVQFACARIGAIFLPANWRLTVNELEYVLRDSAATVVVHEQEFSSLVAPLLGRLDTLNAVAFQGGDTGTRYEQAIAAQGRQKCAPAEVDVESVWAILYTSGTTGRPKGATLSYRMMLANVLNAGPVQLSADTVFLCALPTFHTGGLNCYANPVFHAGGTVVILREFDAARALAILESAAHGITHFFGTPSHYLFIGQQPRFSEARFPALVVAGLGGAPSTHALVRTWLDKGVPLQPAYGMTEIGPLILVSRRDRALAKIGSSGRPVMHCDFKVASPQGDELPAGGIGEIWVKGPVVMSGYWQQPEATQAAFSDGWFMTGDAAYRDDEGDVFIVDRLKDMYISGGENVYPAEVENAIGGLRGVSAVAVIGIPDDTWGEVGRAFIVPRDGHAVTADDVLAHCREHLARFKIPKSILIVQELPRTPAGKVLKRELRDWTSTPQAAST